MHRSWLGGIVVAVSLMAASARAQEAQGCRNWQDDPQAAVDGCTTYLAFLDATGSGHWLYKERGYAYAYFGRAMAQVKLGQLDLALADLTQSIRNDPMAVAYNNRGNVYQAMGDLAKARSDYAEAVRLDPTSEVAKRNLASLEQARQQPPPSAADQALRQHGRELDGCLNGGEFDDILAACDRLLDGDTELTASQRAEAFASRGRVKLYRKQYYGAADDLARAVELSPDTIVYRTELEEARAGQAGSAVDDGGPNPADLVRRAQAALAQLGYAAGSADGKAGPRTRAAVQAYQRSVGLAVDGTVTAELVDKLEAQPR